MRLDCLSTKVSKGAKIRNRYNQVPHLTQDINGYKLFSYMQMSKLDFSLCIKHFIVVYIQIFHLNNCRLFK